MKIAAIDSHLETVLQEIEETLKKNDIVIDINSNKIILVYKDKEYIVKDTESFEDSRTLPRMFDSENLVLIE